jgi:uncharacterized protein YbjT (DUF2867 family)
MKILVTGGTGVVGVAAVKELIKHGHTVRLFSRRAERDAAQFPGEVETAEGTVTDADTIRNIADGVDVVVHIAGIVSESPPETTFGSVNVEGTANLLREAERAGAKRFIHISSLGADTGESNYHQSKLQAEQLVKSFEGDWLILRPANVYGPGDEVVSLVIRMVRTLPAVPVIDGGDLPSQPIWADDFAKAIWLSVERDDLHHQVLELAGPDLVSMNEMLDKVSALTGKQPVRLPLPGWMASASANFMKNVGIDLPFSSDQVTMLLEGNRIAPGKPNALTEIFGIEPTSVDEALRRLVDAQPEMLPADGRGSLHYRRVTAVVSGTDLDARGLFDHICTNFGALFPPIVSANPEPGPNATFCEGATLTLGIPLRGNVQVRVAEHSEKSATCITLSGHPLAGAVVFSTLDSKDGPVVEIQTYDRAATLLDQVAMKTVGRTVQTLTWRSFADNVAKSVGGVVAGEVAVEERDLTDEEAKPVEEWLQDLAMQHKRQEAETQMKAS